MLSPMLPAFLARYPEIDIALTLDDRVIDMVEGGHDVSIRVRAELPDSSLVARRRWQRSTSVFTRLPPISMRRAAAKRPRISRTTRSSPSRSPIMQTVWALSDGTKSNSGWRSSRAIRCPTACFERHCSRPGRGSARFPGFWPGRPSRRSGWSAFFPITRCRTGMSLPCSPRGGRGCEDPLLPFPSSRKPLPAWAIAPLIFQPT
ncbi:MAG: hypothetical protein HPM95_00050 [Alphaproteobacteria bacterium]|nr:hypothetical protein [Alphaproteobacteria bacterium]